MVASSRIPPGIVSRENEHARSEDINRETYRLRIATRDEKLVKHFQSMIHTAMALQFITFCGLRWFWAQPYS